MNPNRKVWQREYVRKRRSGLDLRFGVCKTEGCDKGCYAKGYCRKHYVLFSYRTKNNLSLDLTKPIFHKCIVPNCDLPARKEYCIRHKDRIAKGLPLDLSINIGNKGERNVNWNGGISEYPNHWEMKVARIEKLKQTKGLCEICGGKGSEVHHMDGTKINHNIENLIVVCHPCHMSFFHKQPKNTSKFIRLYGMTMKQIAENYGGSESRYYQFHKQNILKEYLKKKGETTQCL
jgi:hypothetical protein